MKKAAFIGTSCAGKTTSAFAVAAHLRRRGVLADAITSTDRKHDFTQEQLTKTEDAQVAMISQMLNAEAACAARGDCDVLVCDRSVVDLFAYYDLSFDLHSVKKEAMRLMVLSWSKTYDVLIRLEPLPFQDDRRRPSDDFRMKVDARLSRFIEENSISVIRCSARNAVEVMLDAIS